MNKTCNKCKESKELDKFGKKSDTRDGLTNSCKPCTNARKKKLTIHYEDDVVVRKISSGYIRELYVSDILRVIGYYNHEGQLHRPHKPAQYVYNHKGELTSSMNFINGRLIEPYEKPQFDSIGMRKY